MHDHVVEGLANEPAFLTTAQAAQATGITAASLEQYRALRRSGIFRGPDFVKSGRAVFYTREAVDAFIASRRGSR